MRIWTARWLGAATLLTLLSGCGDDDGGAGGTGGSGAGGQALPPTLSAVDPPLGDPLGGARVTVSGAHLRGASVEIGGEPCSDVELVDDDAVRCRAPALPSGSWDVVATNAAGSATLANGYEAWSPAELEGARVFDARVGVETEEPETLYEWQRLTPEIAPDWRVRDGNTLTFLPSTNRFWMVGGWNGFQEPDGFSHVDPELGLYPPENTTNEVWSSADGISWTLELPHEHTQFQRRHVHSTVLWGDALWVIGGDSHQGFYNHDVLSSADGVTWTEVLKPGEPPWQPRALQISGVFDGALWTGGGQDLLGLEGDYAYHNDLWRSEDGVHWTEVAPDGPASATRWGGCGMVDGFVEFKGELWLVGCARYREVAGHELFAEVWSTADGTSWHRHEDPPWAGKAWPNVLVWDDKLWILFGYTYGDPSAGWSAGNANEVWFSEDGETWEALPVDSPVPGSHAQGVAVRGDELVYAGGNYSFGIGLGVDKSAWRLVPFRGAAVGGWVDRGRDALTVKALDETARPAWVTDVFGPGEPGLQFDGSRSVLALEGVDEQPSGRTVLWVARAPYVPLPWGWEETYAPLGTVVGGLDDSGNPNSSIGLSGGAVVMVNREAGTGPSGEPLWARVEGGSDLQDGPGAAHLVGMSHAIDGTVSAWVDGAEVPTNGAASYATPRAWSRLGGSMEGPYYGPNTRFAGTLGAVIILPRAVDEATARRIHAWARGRFGVP
ncbi:MAG: IPT/TIG domain-containing protein [Polyangiaceae bacterium]